MISDSASKTVDCLSFTQGQFTIVAALSTILAVIFETSSWAAPVKSILPHWQIIATVAFTEATAFLLSTTGQTFVRPSRAAILFSAGEALSASALGYFFLGETLKPQELFGALVMLAAMVASASFSTDDDEDAGYSLPNGLDVFTEKADGSVCDSIEISSVEITRVTYQNKKSSSNLCAYSKITTADD